jgi:hypothetical protein
MGLDRYITSVRKNIAKATLAINKDSSIALKIAQIQAVNGNLADAEYLNASAYIEDKAIVTPAIKLLSVLRKLQGRP